jgi:hypothetical protein
VRCKIRKSALISQLSTKNQALSSPVFSHFLKEMSEKTTCRQLSSPAHLFLACQATVNKGFASLYFHTENLLQQVQLPD